MGDLKRREDTSRDLNLWRRIVDSEQLPPHAPAAAVANARESSDLDAAVARRGADARVRLERQRADALSELERRTPLIGPVAAGIERREIERRHATQKRSLATEMRSRALAVRAQHQTRARLMAPANLNKMVHCKTLTAM